MPLWGDLRHRRKLVDTWLGTTAFAAVRAMFLRSAVADHDILDSLAALWSSRRIARGAANRIPGGILHREWHQLQPTAEFDEFNRN